MGKFLHFGTNENEDYKKVKKYLNMPYPKYTHIMQLDNSFDYLGSICLKLLRNKKNIGEIITFEDFEEKKIKKFVEQNPNVEINDMINYYNLSLTIFEIIKKYYNQDGTKK